MHIHGKIAVGLEHLMADLLVDLHRIHREALVRAARLHLEGAGEGLHQLDRLFPNDIDVLFALDDRTDGMHAEDAGDAVNGIFHVSNIADIDASLGQLQLTAGAVDGLADLLHQRVDKKIAVIALEKNFAHANQQHVFHDLSPFERAQHLHALADLRNGFVDFLRCIHRAERKA